MSVIPFIRAGKLRALAVTTARRSASVPDLPTVSEAGVPGFEAITWHGVVVPAATPPQLVERLNRDIVGALAQGDMRERLGALGAEVHPGTPREFADYIANAAPKVRTRLPTMRSSPRVLLVLPNLVVCAAGNRVHRAAH